MHRQRVWFPASRRGRVLMSPGSGRDAGGRSRARAQLVSVLRAAGPWRAWAALGGPWDGSERPLVGDCLGIGLGQPGRRGDELPAMWLCAGRGLPGSVARGHGHHITRPRRREKGDPATKVGARSALPVLGPTRHEALEAVSQGAWPDCPEAWLASWARGRPAHPIRGGSWPVGGVDRG